MGKKSKEDEVSEEEVEDEFEEGSFSFFQYLQPAKDLILNTLRAEQRKGISCRWSLATS